MEEAVLHDLANVVVRQLCADLGKVIARCAKRLMIVDGDSIDALHYQYVCGRIFAVQLWRCDEGHIFVQSMEALKIGGFRLEVHLFLRYQPHLVQHLIEIHQSADGGVF